MKVAIIGAGASGLMLGGLLTQKGYDVTIFDGNEKAWKKLYITGKGRCNITNLCDVSDFLNNVVRGEKFLRSAIYSFSPQDTVNFFENLGLKTKVERGNRVFPLSDKSSDVIKALLKHCKDVKFEYNLPKTLQAPLKKGEEVGEIKVFLNNDLLFSEKVYTIEDIKPKTIMQRLKEFAGNW